MSEKPEEEFEDEESDDLDEEEQSLDVDRLMRDFDPRRKRGARLSNEPAWRQLERKLEERRTRGLVSDFDDYDVDGPDGAASATVSRSKPKSKTRRKPKPKD